MAQKQQLPRVLLPLPPAKTARGSCSTCEGSEGPRALLQAKKILLELDEQLACAQNSDCISLILAAFGIAVHFAEQQRFGHQDTGSIMQNLCFVITSKLFLI